MTTHLPTPEVIAQQPSPLFGTITASTGILVAIVGLVMLGQDDLYNGSESYFGAMAAISGGASLFVGGVVVYFLERIWRELKMANGYQRQRIARKTQ